VLLSLLLLDFRRFGVGLGVHGRPTVAQHPENVVAGEVQLMRFRQQGVDALLDDAAPLAERQLLTPFRDERA
jgi:hypothetical protein